MKYQLRPLMVGHIVATADALYLRGMKPAIKRRAAVTASPRTPPPAEPELSPEQLFITRGRKLLADWQTRVAQYARLDDEEKEITENPDEWLRRECYAYLRETKKSTPRVLANLLKALDGKHRRGSGTKNQPFKRGLLLLSAMEEMRPAAAPSSETAPLLPNLISDHRRRADLGDAMAYASKHNVPPRLFNAFWRYIGMKRIKARLHSPSREPGFEKRSEQTSRPARAAQNR